MLLKTILLLLSLSLCLMCEPAKAAAPLLPRPDVLLDVGHGGIDGGTIFDNIQEKDLNLIISKKVYKALRKRGYHVVMNRDKDYALSDDNKWSRAKRHMRDLTQRSGVANSLQPKIMLSLHVNWSKRPGANGPLVLYQNKSESIILAYHLQKSLNALYGTNGNSVRGKTYYVLKHTNCPTVIIEMGFISNTKDRKMLTSSHHQNQIAKAICDGVEQYFRMVRTSPSDLPAA